MWVLAAGRGKSLISAPCLKADPWPKQDVIVLLKLKLAGLFFGEPVLVPETSSFPKLHHLLRAVLLWKFLTLCSLSWLWKRKKASRAPQIVTARVAPCLSKQGPRVVSLEQNTSHFSGLIDAIWSNLALRSTTLEMSGLPGLEKKPKFSLNEYFIKFRPYCQLGSESCPLTSRKMF